VRPAAARTPHDRDPSDSLRISLRLVPQGRLSGLTPQNGSTQIPRLRSGLRLAARTPRERLSFTKKGAHSAIPQDALITQGLGACGSPCGLRFDPQVSARTPQGGIPRLRSGFPFGLHLRAGLAGSRSAQGLASAKRLNRDPSTSLGTSLRLAPQGRLSGFPLG